MSNSKFVFLVVLLFTCFLKNSIAIEIEKSPNDHRQFAYLKLENGLSVVVVSDQSAEQNACSLEVKAGSFDESDKIPGLAHFVEHALFLGTEQYPNPDEFKQLIDRNGGNYNATTANTFTRFYFTIHPNALEKSLSMFSSFFSAPLFKEEYLDREIKAVDAEFQMNLKSDTMKVIEVDKNTSNPNHPYHRFNIGNKMTLSSHKNILREQAMQFFKEHYSPSKMTLCLVGPQPTDYLLNQVKLYFNNLPKRATVSNRIGSVFEDRHKKVDISIKTEVPYHQMTLFFVLSKYDNFHEEKPLTFVTHFLGLKDKTGLYHYLKEINWINDLTVNQETSFENEDLLDITFSLTPEGFKHKEDVTAAFFEYINFIKKSGYPKNYYDDLKAINSLQWRYYQPEHALFLAERVTANLHKYPPEKILSYDFIFDAPSYEKNEALIKKLFDEVSPKNLRRLILNADVKGNKTTDWYAANYAIQKLPRIKKLSHNFKNKHFAFVLTNKNHYIPDNFEINENDKNSEKNVPIQIPTNSYNKLWYFHDDLFKEPRANVYLNITTNLTTLEPKNVVLTDLFTNLVVDTLKQEFYPAAVTGANFSFYGHARGLGIKFYGYNDKQAPIVKEIFEKFRNYEIDPVKFSLTKDLIFRNYMSYSQNALHEQSMVSLQSLINKQNYHVEDLINALQRVKVEDLQSFITRLKQESSLELFINGNHSIAEAKNIMQSINFPTNMAKPVLPLETVRLLPGKVYYKQLKTDKTNHVLQWYLQNAEVSDEMAARTIILERLISNAFFANLRTQQQLGYAVYTQTYVNNKVSGIIFCIESQYKPAILFQKIKAFLNHYQTEISKLSPQDLEQVKTALIANILQKPKTLSEQSEQIFWPIHTGTLNFKYREKAIKALKGVTVTDIQRLYNQLLSENMGQVIIATQKPSEEKNIIELINWHALKVS